MLGLRRPFLVFMCFTSKEDPSGTTFDTQGNMGVLPSCFFFTFSPTYGTEKFGWQGWQVQLP